MTIAGWRRAAVAAASLLLVAGCSGDDAARPATTSTTSTTRPGATGSTTSAPNPRDVETCASISAADVNALGVAGLAVAQVQNVSDLLQGAAEGGTGCWFSLVPGSAGPDASASLTILAHPDGGAYFDGAVERLTDQEPVVGLGDAAFSGTDSPGSGSTTVITRRGPLVVEVRIGRADVLDRNLLIALAGLTLEREDQP